jgi:glycine cleavage system H protein
MSPEELLYCESHEWVGVAKDGHSDVATIGISKFAVDQLNDLVYIELPKVGANVTAGQEFGEIESVKAVSPIYSPVAGEVIEVNQSLESNLDQLSSDPFGMGWIAKVRMTDKSSLSTLLNHAEYVRQCDHSH